MKGLKCRNHSLHLPAFSLFCLFVLSLLCSSLLVQKTSAVDFNVNLSYVDTIQTASWDYYYRFGSNSQQTFTSEGGLRITRKGNDSSTYPDDPLYIDYMCSHHSRDFIKDDFYNFKVYATISDNTTDVIGTLTTFSSADNFRIANISVSYQDGDTVSQWKRLTFTDSDGVSYNAVYPYNSRPQQFYVYDVVMQATRSGNFPICLGRNLSTIHVYTLPPMQYSEGVLNYQYQFRILGGSQTLHYKYDTSAEEMNDKDDEDRQNMEDQQSDSQDSSDDSQEEAESTGTTLLAAFSSFVTAITNASPSNCNLLMNMGNLNLGNVNLCQLSPPPAFQAIGSIFLILFCVPLSIATARKVINLFRSFQS